MSAAANLHEQACPACGKRYPADSLFCPADGSPLAGPGRAAASSDSGAYLDREILGHIRIRQLIGIGQKEPAQSSCDCSEFLVGAHLVEPLGDRPASEVGGDWRIPPLLGESIGSDRIAEAFGQPIPGAVINSGT